MNRKFIISIIAIVLSGIVVIISSCQEDDPTTVELESIIVKTAPSKVDYYVGEVLDLSGLVITLIKDNDETEDIAFNDFTNKGIICSPINGTELITELTEVTITHLTSGISIVQPINCMKVTDIDGNIYQVVKIGEQIWMAENLKTTHYADGTELLLVESNTNWDEIVVYTDKVYCYYENSLSNLDNYGALYTWGAAMNGEAGSDANPSGIQGVCPDGWHLPSDTEWIELTDYLAANGHSGNEGTALKAISGWNNGIAVNGTDDYGFNALPGGDRSISGTFGSIGSKAIWWSSTKYLETGTKAWYRHLNTNNNILDRFYYYGKAGWSVRCVKD